MRRFLGLLLCGAGAALLLAVGFDYARAAYARKHVAEVWKQESSGSLASHWPDPLKKGDPAGRITIPAVGLDEVVIEGVDPADLDIAPGHFPGSALPGEAGNAIISAHRDRQFHALQHVVLGDTVITESRAGRVTWIVVSRRIVERGTPALFATKDPTLTLTTCWPIRYVGPAPDRLLITAKLAGSGDRPASARSSLSVR